MDDTQSNGAGEQKRGPDKAARRASRRWTDEQKAAVLAELDACATAAEVRDVRRRHGVQANQTQRWREQGAVNVSPPATSGTYGSTVARVVRARDVFDYLASLEERIAALEASRDSLLSHLSKALGAGG